MNMDEPTCGHPPIMPASVGADQHAATEWHRIRDVCPPQLFNAMDTSVLTQYCLAWSMLIRSQQDIDENGLIVDEPVFDKEGGVAGHKRRTNEALTTWKAANETLLKCTDRLGLSPTARTRIQLPKRDDTPSKFKALMGRTAHDVP